MDGDALWEALLKEQANPLERLVDVDIDAAHELALYVNEASDGLEEAFTETMSDAEVEAALRMEEMAKGVEWGEPHMPPFFFTAEQLGLEDDPVLVFEKDEEEW